VAGSAFRHGNIRAAVALFLALSSGGALPPSVRAGGGLPDSARVLRRLIGLPGLPNVGEVAPGIFRGGQPGREGYATLRRMGIRTVLSLRSRHDERAAVESEGIRYRSIPFPIPGPVDDRTVRKAVAVLRDPGNRPVYVHCAEGKDRTGVVIAAYRMEVEGWSREEAVAEMQAFGFHDLWVNLMEYVLRYPRESGKGNSRGGGR